MSSIFIILFSIIILFPPFSHSLIYFFIHIAYSYIMLYIVIPFMHLSIIVLILNVLTLSLEHVSLYKSFPFYLYTSEIHYNIITYFIRYYVYNKHTRYSSTLYRLASQQPTQKLYKICLESKNNAVDCTIFLVWPTCWPGP